MRKEKCDRCGRLTKDLTPHDFDKVFLCNTCTEKWLKLYDSEVRKTSERFVQFYWHKLFYNFVTKKIEKEKVEFT